MAQQSPAAVRTIPPRRTDRPAILDSLVAARLGRPGPRRRRWYDNEDLRDGLMTFALTFTGAMIFLL